MAVELIPRFDGKEAYWWLIQAEQYFGSRRMREEMKLRWAVAFALRGDALDWWISWKEKNPNISWWNFSKAILKKFQPEVWDCLLDSENEGQENRGNTKINVEKQEPIASQTKVKICEVDDEANNTNSLMSATAVKVQRSDEEMDNPSHAEDTLPTSPLPSHLRNSATGKIRELGFRDEPNEQPPPEWLDRQPLLSKPPDIGSHTVVAYIPKIKSRNKKVPLSATLSSQKPVTRRLTVASKFDAEGNFLISCTTQSFCFKLWDPGGHLCYPSP